MVPWQILGVYNPGHVRVACVQLAHHPGGGGSTSGSRGLAIGAQIYEIQNKIVKLTGYTYDCNSLTTFEYEA